MNKLLWFPFCMCITPTVCESIVVAPSQIFTTVGSNVILPCHLEPSADIRGLTLEWGKPDMKPDPLDRLRRVDYVHLYRDRKEVSDMKIMSYHNRTRIFSQDLIRGNLSLQILNVTKEDGGRYRCFIPKLKSSVKSAVLLLTVEDPTVTTARAMTSPTTTPENPHERNKDNGDPASAGRSRIGLVIALILFSFLGLTILGLIHWRGMFSKRRGGWEAYTDRWTKT